MIAALILAFASPAEIFASERGRDDWPGTSGRPVKSIERVQEEVARIRADGNLQPITVHLRGRFPLRQTLRLGVEFSQVTLDGHGRTILDGATEIGPWSPVTIGGKELWSTVLPPGAFPRQLFVGDGQVPRSRMPKEGFYTLSGLVDGAEGGPWNEGQSVARYRPADVPALAHLGDAEFVAHHYWIQSRMRIREMDARNGVIRFDRKSVFRLTDDYTGGGAPFRIENALEAVSQPGEWASVNSSLYYLPRKGERVERFRASVATFPTLISAKGVRGLTLRGIRFQHTEWQPPRDSAGDPQAAVNTPAAIVLEDARNCQIVDCEVRQVGTYGVEIVGASTENRIERTDFDTLGGGGIKIGHGTTQSVVEDCRIERGGRIFAPAVGVWIGDSGGNRVSHNLIRDFYYTGISVGWVWGYGPSRGKDNRIEFNDISQIGQGELSDMGGIYTLGVSPGTVLRGNRIRDVDARGYGGWGIYLDEGSTGILVEKNLVERVKTGSFHQHYGRENLIRNNVFLNARTAGQLIRTRPEDHKSFTLEKNVVQWADTDLLGSNWDGTGFELDRNVYWRTDGKPVTFGGKTLLEWQSRGHDRQSLVADPQMTVRDSGVTFRRGSPALALEIEPLDMRTVGPRR